MSKPETKKCAKCGKKFTAKVANAKYCSKACKNAVKREVEKAKSKSKKAEPKKTEKKCDNCKPKKVAIKGKATEKVVLAKKGAVKKSAKKEGTLAEKCFPDPLKMLAFGIDTLVTAIDRIAKIKA